MGVLKLLGFLFVLYVLPISLLLSAILRLATGRHRSRIGIIMAGALMVPQVVLIFSGRYVAGSLLESPNILIISVLLTLSGFLGWAKAIYGAGGRYLFVELVIVLAVWVGLVASLDSLIATQVPS